jgi:hypothetical protein
MSDVSTEEFQQFTWIEFESKRLLITRMKWDETLAYKKKINVRCLLRDSALRAKAVTRAHDK